MKNLTWQNPGQLFVAQELIKIVKLKCCGIKAYLKELSTIISTPLILLGANRSMDIIEEVMNDVPNIQLASLGRPLLSEPDLINKWAENRDYRPRCVSCNHCWDTEPNSCILNRKQLNVRVLEK